MSKKLQIPAAISLSLSLLCLSADATETNWVYQSYSARTGDKAAPGYITLKEEGDLVTLRLVAGTMNNCYRQELKAMIERTAESTTIIAEPLLVGCDKIRIIVNNDGSGGSRSTWEVDKWVLDPKDRVLTLIRK